jgi:hypothetical protein
MIDEETVSNDTLAMTASEGSKEGTRGSPNGANGQFVLSLSVEVSDIPLLSSRSQHFEVLEWWVE